MVYGVLEAGPSPVDDSKPVRWGTDPASTGGDRQAEETWMSISESIHLGCSCPRTDNGPRAACRTGRRSV